MGVGCTRVIERVQASVGALTEVPSHFEAVLDVPDCGVLWAVPSLIANGLFLDTEEFFSMPKGFYGLIHIFLLLALMALARIKTPEQLRQVSAGEWGNLLGLDRIPEVRTLREKIKGLTESGEVEKWSESLSVKWMENDPEAAGILYVDGHVNVYHGSKTKLLRRYVSRERLCLRGTTDYWVNDQIGRPFFVINTPFSDGLLAMLRNEIIPRLLKDVPNQPTEEKLKANPLLFRFIIIFDREGYSPEFFREMWEKYRIACMTYHKYQTENWQEKVFKEYTVSTPSGNEVTMKLAERDIYLSKKVIVREIRKLSKSGHQTAIISTDHITDIATCSVHMFSRWSQENFFKYMLQHFDLDRLISYKVEDVSDPKKKVINPDYRKIEGKIKSKAGILGRRTKSFGELYLDEQTEAKEIEKFEIKKGELKEEIELIRKDLNNLKEERKKIQQYLPWKDLPEEVRFKQFSKEKKQFMDTIRMIAYRAETAMAIILRKDLTRAQDARALAREIFSTEADIIPNEAEKTLTIRLHHMANRLSDKAVRHLAENLNATETLYPGTDLRMIFKLVSD